MQKDKQMGDICSKQELQQFDYSKTFIKNFQHFSKSHLDDHTFLSIGYHIQQPDFEIITTEHKMNLPVNYFDPETRNCKLGYNNHEIEHNSVNFKYVQIDEKGSNQHQVTFFKITNRTTQQILETLEQHDEQLHKHLFESDFGSHFKLADIQVGYLDLQKFNETQGFQSRFSYQTLLNIRNTAISCGCKKFVYWVESVRPLFTLFPSPSGDCYGVNDCLRKGYILYLEGNCNVVLTAPHGGRNFFQGSNDFLQKEQRFYHERDEQCTRAQLKDFCKDCEKEKLVDCLDEHTAEIAVYTQINLAKKLGRIPHLIISLTSRKQVELNRELCTHCQYSTVRELQFIYNQYHDLITHIVESIPEQNKIMFDLHGLSKQKLNTQIGYNLGRKQYLEKFNNHIETEDIQQIIDGKINQLGIKNSSSIKYLANRQQMHSDALDLIFGTTSFGHILAKQDFLVIPSDTQHFGNTQEFMGKDSVIYFSGGWTTKKYSSLKKAHCDVIQIEMSAQIRDLPHLEKNGEKLSEAIYQFIKLHKFQ